MLPCVLCSSVYTRISLSEAPPSELESDEVWDVCRLQQADIRHCIISLHTFHEVQTQDEGYNHNTNITNL